MLLLLKMACFSYMYLFTIQSLKNLYNNNQHMTENGEYIILPNIMNQAFYKMVIESSNGILKTTNKQNLVSFIITSELVSGKLATNNSLNSVN